MSETWTDMPPQYLNSENLLALSGQNTTYKLIQVKDFHSYKTMKKRKEKVTQKEWLGPKLALNKIKTNVCFFKVVTRRAISLSKFHTSNQTMIHINNKEEEPNSKESLLSTYGPSHNNKIKFKKHNSTPLNFNQHLHIKYTNLHNLCSL